MGHVKEYYYISEEEAFNQKECDEYFERLAEDEQYSSILNDPEIFEVEESA